MVFGSLKKQKRAPKKAAARKVDVMLLETLSDTALVIRNSVVKLAREMVVPMKAES